MKAINLRSLLFVGTLALFTVSCREENRNDDRYGTNRRNDRDNSDYKEVAYSESSGRQLLIGNVWKAREDLNSSGLDEGLERRGEFYFYANNMFSLMDDGKATQTGTWAYDGNTLSLRYSGATITHYYDVRELTEDKLRIAASDGSELLLVDKDMR
jgi:hypothetical protein